MVYKQASLPEFFSYVPANADQVVINRPARNIQNTKDLWSSQIPEWVRSQFKQIELMFMVQVWEWSGDQLLFLETNSEFSPQDFLSTLNPATEVLYSYKRFEDGHYLFAPKSLLDKYQKPSPGKWFFDNSMIRNYASIYKSYGMTILSHTQKSLWLPDQFSQLFANVDYLIMWIDSTNKKTSFISHALFTKTNPRTGDDFSPKCKKYLKASTMAYIEVGPIASLLVSPQLNTTFTGAQLIQQAVLAETIQQFFKHNTALVISKWSNALNMWITLVAQDETLFTKIKPRIPAIGQWLKQQDMFASAKFTPIETADKIGYMLSLAPGQEIWLFVQQQDHQTIVSMGNPLLDGSSSQKLLYTDDSLATINVDMDQILWVYKQVFGAGVSDGLPTTDTALSQFQGKILRATVIADRYGLWLEWEIK